MELILLGGMDGVGTWQWPPREAKGSDFDNDNFAGVGFLNIQGVGVG